jgi:hypothetical protein
VGARLIVLRRLGALLLPALALLLLAAHFFRAGLIPVAAACVALLALLLVRSSWAGGALQVALALGVLEWLRTAWVFAAARAAIGQPYARLLVILSAVALVTALAALLLRTKTAREHFAGTH